MSRCERLFVVGFLTLLTSPACQSSELAGIRLSYPVSYDLGKPISASIREELFTTIPPDGAGLPDGSGTFESGQLTYEVKCMACHGDRMQGTDIGMSLLGGRGTLTSDAPRKTVESYWPYATSVFSYIRNTMPKTAPGTLSSEESYSLMAYILGSAGVVPANVVMDKQTLVEVQMPNRDGFVRDDRPDVNTPRLNN